MVCGLVISAGIDGGRGAVILQRHQSLVLPFRRASGTITGREIRSHGLKRRTDRRTAQIGKT